MKTLPSPPIRASLVYPAVSSCGEEIAFQFVLPFRPKTTLMLMTAAEFETLCRNMRRLIKQRRDLSRTQGGE